MEIRDMLETTDEGLVALCALLLEMAHIDGEFSEQEALLLIDLLSTQMAQSIVRGEALLHRARGQLRVTRDIDELTERVKQEFDEDERTAVLGLLWQVAFADGRLDQFEAYLLERMGKLLDIPERRIRQEHRFAIEQLAAKRRD
jgi:uncharacterized tellurite resistance protein B-like protein